MFIEVRLEKEQAEFIREHFDDLRQKESLMRTSSGSIARENKYGQIVRRFDDAFLEQQVIAFKQSRRRTSCASSEEGRAE
jgi:uncharacterized protein YpiB (UPF0302 family)